MDIEITDAEIEKIILKREKKKEYQRVYDANKYQQIKEKRLKAKRKQDTEKKEIRWYSMKFKENESKGFKLK